MNHVFMLLHFIKSYWRRALLALVLLTSLVFMDLAIPRLIQRIIDHKIVKQDQSVVRQTALVMIDLSVLSTVIAIGNNYFSVQVGEGVARDLRDALFPILILDEATSSVDTRTEVRIQNALLHLMHGRTSFVIAHRLSTIRDAHNVVVISNGELIEQGTHAQLLERRGLYHHLYVSQFKGQEI